jgi:twitching motility protein PilT
VAAIDSLLKLAQSQGADELRLAVGEPPQMFAHGAPTRLSVPATSEQTLRMLLDSILTPELERELTEQGSSETTYDSGTLGVYRVTFRAREGGGFTVVVAQAETAAAPHPPAPPPPGKDHHVERTKPRAARTSTKLAEWLQLAAAAHASDLHLAEGDPPYIRSDGVLERLADEVVHDLQAVLPLDPTQAARLASGESIDTALELGGVGRVRVHVYATESGAVAALRLLVRAAPRFATLNMPAAFDDLIDLPHGLVLVCGAAGAGKSTTLAALAQEALYRRSILLVTLEDPIEYVLTPAPTSLVRRRQLGRDVRDFAPIRTCS